MHLSPFKTKIKTKVTRHKGYSDFDIDRELILLTFSKRHELNRGTLHYDHMGLSVKFPYRNHESMHDVPVSFGLMDYLRLIHNPNLVELFSMVGKHDMLQAIVLECGRTDGVNVSRFDGIIMFTIWRRGFLKASLTVPWDGHANKKGNRTP